MRAVVLVIQLLIPMVACGAEFAVVQSASPTTDGGTQDFVSPGFSTPSCALFFGGYGVDNGTPVSHAGFWIGAFDGTRQNSMGMMARHNVLDSFTRSIRDVDSALLTILDTDKTKNGEATASFVSDGARLTWPDAPPSAYQTNAVLIGGSGVQNCYVGTVSASATLNGSVTVTDPGFQPDVLIAWTINSTATTTMARASLGFATNEPGPTIVQRSLLMSDQDAQANMVVTGQMSDTRLLTNLSTLSTVEVTAFSSTGFSIATRDAGTGPAIGYMAIKLNGLAAKLMTSPSPTAVGQQSITGAGFRPQFGLMLHGESAAMNTYYAADDGEVFGLSAFTDVASASASTYHEDSNGTSITESVTDNKACRTRKDSADYATCTMVGFHDDGVTLNYTATNVTARQRSVLLIQSSFVPASARRANPKVME